MKTVISTKNTDDVINEIDLIRNDNIETDSYLTATLVWMETNDIVMSDKNFLSKIPTYILDKIREEAFDENLLKPSSSPSGDSDADSFNELFF